MPRRKKTPAGPAKEVNFTRTGAEMSDFEMALLRMEAADVITRGSIPQPWRPEDTPQGIVYTKEDAIIVYTKEDAIKALRAALKEPTPYVSKQKPQRRFYVKKGR